MMRQGASCQRERESQREPERARVREREREISFLEIFVIDRKSKSCVD